VPPMAPSVLITVSRVIHAVFGELLAFFSAPRADTIRARTASEQFDAGLDRSPLGWEFGGVSSDHVAVVDDQTW